MTCPLASPQTKGQCHWCGKKLKGRQTRWCSRQCARDATKNHRWTQAKAAAKADAAHYLCANAFLAGGGANFTEITHPSGCEGLTQSPEVDHIEPCNGKHSQWGCWHHQDNLRVLCPPCHKKVTAAQATARAALRKQGKV